MRSGPKPSVDRAFVLGVVLLAAMAAGCAQVGTDVGLLRDTSPRAPYYAEHRDALAPQYNRSWPLPVDTGAKDVLVNASLELRSGSLLPDDKTPAAITVTLLDPSGAALGAADLDPAHPAASFHVKPKAAGAYALVVAGSGPAADAQAAQVRAAYVIAAQIAY